MTNKRKVVISNGETYHVYNRTVGGQEIFLSKRELTRALNLLDFYRFPQEIKYSKFKMLSLEDRGKYLKKVTKLQPLVDIYSFSLMPDHYHLLLKQLKEVGIRIIISNFQNAFAKYFNKKYNRDGSMFKSPFKAKWIESDELFKHVSRYIHLNPVTSYIIEIDELPTFPWTSFPFYIGNNNAKLVNTDFLLKMFGDRQRYKDFVFNQSDYQRELHLIKKLLLE